MAAHRTVYRICLWICGIAMGLCCVAALLFVGYMVLVVLAFFFGTVTFETRSATTEVDGYTLETEVTLDDKTVTVRKDGLVLARERYLREQRTVYVYREGGELFVAENRCEGIVVDTATGKVRSMAFAEGPKGYFRDTFGRFAFLDANGESEYRWVARADYPEWWNKDEPPDGPLVSPTDFTAEALVAQLNANKHRPTPGNNLRVVGTVVAATEPGYGRVASWIALASRPSWFGFPGPVVVCMPEWSQRAAFRTIPLGGRVTVVGTLQNRAGDGTVWLEACTLVK